MQELLEISGGLDCMELKLNEAGPYASTIPHLVYIAFQMMFAMITPALITGSLVGRVKFSRHCFYLLCSGPSLYTTQWRTWYGDREISCRDRIG